MGVETPLKPGVKPSENSTASPSLGMGILKGYNKVIKGRKGTMAIRTVTRAGVGLVVGIIILGLLVLGGLYLVRERGEQARREEAINIADQQLQAESDEDIAISTDGDINETPAQEQTPATTGQTDTGDDSPISAAPPAAASELPQTGPDAISFVGLGLLSFAVVSFIHSRKLV